MERSLVWYLFGVAAVTLIGLRWQITLDTIRGKYRLSDPILLSFSGGLMLGALGVLCKFPMIAPWLDSFSPNLAWLLADSLFLTGVTLGTFWVDLMRQPQTAHLLGWRVMGQSRTFVLVAVLITLTLITRLELATWATLERGGIDVGGRFPLLLARLAYFLYATYGLGYIALHFYQQRKQMVDRFKYLRLSIPFAAIALATVAPLLQLIATLEGYFQPALVSVIWPGLWLVVSLIQVITAILIIASFWPSAYRFVAWLDKQVLIYRLQSVYNSVVQSRSDLKLKPVNRPTGLLIREPDEALLRLVNNLSDVNYFIGGTAGRIAAPAGGLMPPDAAQALASTRRAWAEGLSQKPISAIRPLPTGDTYALAKWYAQMPVSQIAGS